METTFWGGAAAAPALPGIGSTGDLRFQLDPALAVVVSGGAQSIPDRSAYASAANVWTATSSTQRPTAGGDAVGAYVQMVQATHSEMLCSVGGLQYATENHGLIAFVDIPTGLSLVSEYLGFGTPHGATESALGNYGDVYMAEMGGFGAGTTTSTLTIAGGPVVVEAWGIGGALALYLNGQALALNAVGAGTQNVSPGYGLFDRGSSGSPTPAKIYQAFGVAGPSAINAGGNIVQGPNGIRWQVLQYIRQRFPVAAQPTSIVFNGDSLIRGGNNTGADLGANPPGKTVSAYCIGWLLADHGKTAFALKVGDAGDRVDQIWNLAETTVFPLINPLAALRCGGLWYGINDVLESTANNPPDYASGVQCQNRVLAQISTHAATMRIAGVNGPLVVCTLPDCTNLAGLTGAQATRAAINNGIRAMNGKNGVLVYDAAAALFAVEPVPAAGTQWRDDGLHLTIDNQYVTGQGGWSLIGQGISNLLAPYLP